MIKDSALVVVDMLYDFIDGSLACRNAVQAVRNTRNFIEGAAEVDNADSNEIVGGFPILFVRDHHPSDHCSFKEYGGIWPDHCIAGTHGGEIHEELQQFVVEDLVFDKGCDRSHEQYSGADGHNEAGQSLAEILELLDARDVYVCGIATEFCVKNTCEDLAKAGFNVHLLTECIGYVDAEGHKKALEQMDKEGIRLI